MNPKHAFLTFLAGIVSSGSLLAEAPASVAAALQPFVDKHELAGAVALVADKDKVLAVEAVGFADSANNRIASFNPADFAGTFASFGSAGSGDGQFNQPVGVTVDSAGNVWVADTFNNRIVELTGAAAVPEPATSALLLSGTTLLALRRRR